MEISLLASLFAVAFRQTRPDQTANGYEVTFGPPRTRPVPRSCSVKGSRQMQRHRKATKAAAATGYRTRIWLGVARAQVEALDREILAGRWNVQELRDELVRMIGDVEDRLAGTPIK